MKKIILGICLVTVAVVFLGAVAMSLSAFVAGNRNYFFYAFMVFYGGLPAAVFVYILKYGYAVQASGIITAAMAALGASWISLAVFSYAAFDDKAGMTAFVTITATAWTVFVFNKVADKSSLDSIQLIHIALAAAYAGYAIFSVTRDIDDVDDDFIYFAMPLFATATAAAIAGCAFTHGTDEITGHYIALACIVLLANATYGIIPLPSGAKPFSHLIAYFSPVALVPWLLSFDPDDPDRVRGLF